MTTVERLQFSVPGEPGRRSLECAIAWSAQRVCALGNWYLAEGPLELRIDVYTSPPRGLKPGMWAVRQPDSDRVIRAVVAALTRERVWVRRSQIVMLGVRSFYGEPRTDITVRPLRDDEILDYMTCNPAVREEPCCTSENQEYR